ncbi:MFS transporter [Sphingomonas sp. PB4P5]|uniref:MFS transporter n=1 Tax=Parasphingomonas puruogangriensis TaxID=3096155 RepID=UPI002FC66F3F
MRQPSEFRRGWPVVLVAASGVGLGIAGLLTYTAGIFANDLRGAIGLSRTDLGWAFFLSTVALALALPLTGWLIDRFGARGPAAAGSLALSAGFLALGTSVHSVAGYIVVMAAIGFFAACSAPVAYTRAISGAFDRSRGLALGLTQLGIGVSAMAVPPILAQIVATHGWQSGYLVLSGLALLGIIPALSLPPKSRDPIRPQGADVAGTLRSREFILLLAAFGMMALAFAGLLPHFVPMLRDAGVDAQRAGLIAGVIGASVIVSRVIVGWLADRIEAAWLAAVCCCICALGCLTLASQGATFAWLGAIALGTAMGAEADLIGYMTARRFGVAGYGRLYAVQYASFMLMAGLSPLWVGALADNKGGYATALVVAAIGLVLAAVIFLYLPASKPRAAPAN